VKRESMKRAILVTGASGFVGNYMVDLLVQRGFQVVALADVTNPSLPPGVEWVRANLADPASLAELPRVWWGVIHLAAISVPSLFATTAPIVANLQMTLNLLEHIDSGRFLIVSSCHVYAPASTPRHEDSPIRPQGRYGLSKHLCEQLMPQYLHKLDVRIARPFNHVGLGMRPELMIPSMIRRILGETEGDQSPLIMHGTNSIRDFIDIRDVVSAYLAIVELNDPVSRVYNVCTGQAVSVREVASETLRLAGSSRPVEFQGSPNSQDDVPYVVGDPRQLLHETGWSAKYHLADSLLTLLKKSEL
jgi:GDP-4-dehydro-6-deoxy-D-mannose reductase